MKAAAIMLVALVAAACAPQAPEQITCDHPAPYIKDDGPLRLQDGCHIEETDR
jgi:hypothetical protein